MTGQNDKYRNLFLEMEEYEKRGVGIFMNNACVSPLTIADACTVREDSVYMRDYVSEGGRIKEIHFNAL